MGIKTASLAFNQMFTLDDDVCLDPVLGFPTNMSGHLADTSSTSKPLRSRPLPSDLMNSSPFRGRPLMSCVISICTLKMSHKSSLFFIWSGIEGIRGYKLCILFMSG